MARQEQKLFRVGAAALELGLHPMTVRRWIKAGRIQVVHVGREVRIPRSEIERITGGIDERLLVLYGRVSERERLDSLALQLERLQAWADAERQGMETLVLSDVGSGLHAGRKELQRLLKLVCEDKVGEIAVTDTVRLTRFGQEFLDILFTCFGVEVTVLGPEEGEDAQLELTDDFVALIASFSERLYGIRSRKQQELMQCVQTVILNS